MFSVYSIYSQGVDECVTVKTPFLNIPLEELDLLTHTGTVFHRRGHDRTLVPDWPTLVQARQWSCCTVL